MYNVWKASLCMNIIEEVCLYGQQNIDTIKVDNLAIKKINHVHKMLRYMRMMSCIKINRLDD